MGTNYYWTPAEPCQHCSRPYEPIHIGKRSAGWHFLLHVIPEDGVSSLEDWKLLWQKPGSSIRNEYDEPITPEEMEQIIFEWNTPEWKPGHPRLRSEYDPNHCIGVDESGSDLIIGEFS